VLTDGFGHFVFYALAGLYTVAVAVQNVIYQVLPDQNLGNGGLNVTITGSPVAGQALVATSPTTASWQVIFGTTINYPAVPNQFLNSYTSSTGLFTSAQPVLSGIGNPTSNVNFVFNANTFTRSYSSVSQTNEQLINTTQATVFTNNNSPGVTLTGTFWNGTSTPDQWSMQGVLGFGTNPTSTIVFAHIGTSGVASVQVPNLITANATVSGIIFDNNGRTGNFGQVLTSTSVGVIWANAPTAPVVVGSGAANVSGPPGNYTITVFVSGSSTTAASADTNVSTAPTGDILVADGNGNLQDSGVSITSLANPVLLFPSANQTINAYSLLPALGNKTQSLGSASAPWNMFPLQTNGGATITLYGSTDPYGGLISAAIAALPSTGGTVDARAVGVASVAQGAINPGAKAVTLLLGPYTYTFTNITLQSDFKLIGVGGFGSESTIIQSVTTGNVALFTLPQANNSAVVACELKGFTVLGTVGNTSQDCFFMDCSGFTNCGLWYSQFTSIYVQGFMGKGMHLKGRPNDYDSINQFLVMTSVFVQRPASGSEALYIEGANAQMQFINCEFDGNSLGDGTNIYIGQSGTGQSASPDSMKFDLLTCQKAAVGINISGAFSVLFTNCHFEQIYGAIQINFLTGGVYTYGVNIDSCFFDSNVGVNSGSGYILDVNTFRAVGVSFQSNLYGSPDSVIINAGAQVFSFNNSTLAGGLVPLVPYFNGTATPGNGVPVEIGAVSVTTQSAIYGPFDLVVATPVAGRYRVSWYAKVTRAASTSSQLGQLILSYQDADGQTISITSAPAYNLAGAVVTDTTTNSITTGVLLGAPLVLNCSAGNAISGQFQYASVGATAMQYELSITCELL
jgi:hypothetical protein